MRGRAAGFTLLEVLVVVLVIGMIVLVLGQASRLAQMALASFERSASVAGEMEPAERALRQIIERMDPGRYPEPPAISGSAHSLSFTSELPDLAVAGGLLADVRIELTNGQVVLWWTAHPGGVPFGAPPPAQRTVLLAPVSGFDIAYSAKYKDTDWQPAWSRPALPAKVRLQITPQGGSAWPPIIARPMREAAEE